MRLALEARDARLVLDTNDRGWCQVVLHLPDRVVSLGAETHENVIARLSKGLGDALAGPIAGWVDDVPVRCTLMLFEHHCSVYAVDVAESLHVQDRDAKWIAVVTLSAEERHGWLSRLQHA
jgi:hypothetical protein